MAAKATVPPRKSRTQSNPRSAETGALAVAGKKRGQGGAEREEAAPQVGVIETRLDQQLTPTEVKYGMNQEARYKLMLGCGQYIDSPNT